VLSAANQTKLPSKALLRSVALSPRAAEPHFELARLKLDGDGDARRPSPRQNFSSA